MKNITIKTKFGLYILSFYFLLSVFIIVCKLQITNREIENNRLNRFIQVRDLKEITVRTIKKEVKTKEAKAENISVKEQIRLIAQKRNFQYTDYLLRLANCESRFNKFAVNINRNGTKDKGVFQINDIHKISDNNRNNVEFSTNWTIDQILAGRQTWWMCDKLVKKNPNKYK